MNADLMTDEEMLPAAELVDAFDGTSVHHWDLHATMHGPNKMVVTAPSGKRYGLSITVRLLETHMKSEEPK